MKFFRAFRQAISTPSLQRRLIFLLLISGLLPLLLMGSVTTIYATQLLEQEIGNNLDNMAGTTIDKLDRVMFDRVNDIQTFASSNEARSLDPEILTPYMNHLVRTYSPLYPLMIVADKQGVIRALSTIDTGTYSSMGSSPLGQSVADADWFRVWFDHPLPAGQCYMTDLHRDPLFAQIRPQASSTVIFSFPIQNERSATIGVWALFLDWHIVETLVDQALIAPRASGANSLSITMVDKNGMVLIAPDKTAVLRDHIQLDQTHRQAIQKRTLSSTYGRSWLDPDRLAGAAISRGYSTYLGQGWIAIATQDRTEALRSVQMLWRTILLLGGLAIFGVSVLGLLAGRRTARPIITLTSAAAHAAEGNLDHQVPILSKDEIGQLGHMFNHMIAQLRESQQTLEDRIAQRTSDLQQALTTLQSTLTERDLLNDQLRESSIPLIPLINQMAVLPVVGDLDGARVCQLQETLLSGIEQAGLRVVLVDITGVLVVDFQVAHSLIEMTAAAKLLGCKIILVGIRPEVAQTMVHLGVRIEEMSPHATLQSGLLVALREIGYTLKQQDRIAAKIRSSERSLPTKRRT